MLPLHQPHFFEKPAMPSRSEATTATANRPTDAGWKPVKRATVTVSYVKDKLLGEGWSVPVVVCITDLNFSKVGICMVSHSEAWKAMK